MEEYERKNQIEIEEFINGYSLSDLFRYWKGTLDDFGINSQNMFTDINLSDPSLVGRSPAYSWWFKNELSIQIKKFRDHIKTWPSTRGPIYPEEFRKGELETLGYLWILRNNNFKVFALLLCCSLFPKVKSSRTHYPREEWPPFYCVDALYQMAEKEWRNGQGLFSWHYSCTNVIPTELSDRHFKIDSVVGIVKFAAIEHAQLLSKYQPVRLIFD